MSSHQLQHWSAIWTPTLQSLPFSSFQMYAVTVKQLLSRYTATISTQPRRMEEIATMKGMFIKRIQNFYKAVCPLEFL